MMRRSVVYVAVVCALSVFVLWGCPKKSEVTSAPQPKETAAPKEQPKAEQTAAEKTAQPAQKEEGKERAAAAAAGLQPVYFDFDKSFIRDDAKAAMKANAEYLKANPKVAIKIEGNCDDRGTKEYNQALGQRRAAAAKKYLTDLGVAASRISLISYGKEKPVCSASTEECWQKNRRDDFVAAK
jgi:peptidoglycan-associated lipoprotein